MFPATSIDFFKRLIDAPGPSGYEEIPRRIWREEVRGFSHAQVTDVNGSEIATINGKSARTSFLLMGHIDHLGLIVRYIDEKGYLYFVPVGGVDPDTYISQKVRLLGPKGIVIGIIGKIAAHLMDEEDRKKKMKIHELWIDIGARSKEEAAEYAPVGTAGTVGEGVIELLNSRVAGRIDNRFGAFVIAEVLRRLWSKKDALFPTVHAAATTQEETAGKRIGATTAAWRTNPTAAIAVDVNHSTDIPSCDKRKEGEMTMGKGAIITMGVSTSNRLARAVMQVAREKSLPFQLDTETGWHGTDADAAPSMRNGVAIMSIGMPLRYMHNTVEMGDLADIESVVNILTEFLLSVREDVDYTP